MQKYWEKQSEIMAEGKVHIFCAQANNKIIGVVGLEACTKPNGDHRGEIFKLIVSAQWRRRGVARQLMTVATEFAAQLGLKLLVLDTRSDDITVDFYQSLGWIKAGVIPHYAQSTLGEYQATTLMYLPLTPDTQNIL
jgi:Acetyltransferases